jgi:hypothetical protein
VELAFVYELEHDPDVLEYYDQTPSILLDYESANERRLAVMHTPDYFVIHKNSAGWQECKHERELEKLAQKSPNRYCRSGDGHWRCPPGEAHASRFGLYYRLRSSAEIDWTLQRNIQSLDDYWRFDAVGLASETREIVEAEVSAAPGLRLADLFRNTQGIASRDDVHRLIAAGDIYVDLRAAGIMEPDKARVFPNREAALASRHIEGQRVRAERPRFVLLAPGTSITCDGKTSTIVDSGDKTVSLRGEDCAVSEIPLETFEAFVKDGRVAPMETAFLPGARTSNLLAAASEDDLRVANQRFEIVRRHLNGEPPPDGPSVPERTLRLWAARYGTTTRVRNADSDLCRQIVLKHRKSGRSHWWRRRGAKPICELSRVRKVLEEYLASDAPAPPLDHIAATLSYAVDGSLRQKLPELCHALSARIAEQRRARVAAIEPALELALQETPAPSLRQMAKQLGFSAACVLKAHAPALYDKLKARWQTYAETCRAELRTKLLVVWEESPPPSLKAVYARFGVTESIVNTSFPELRREIGLRHLQYQRQQAQGRRDEVWAEIREIVRMLHAQGICPSVPRVTSRLKSGSLREWRVVGKAVNDARKELSEG